MKSLIIIVAMLALTGGAMSAEPFDPSFRVLDWRLPATDKRQLSKFMGFGGIEFNRRTQVWTVTTKEGDEWYIPSPDAFLLDILRQAAEYGYRCSMEIAPKSQEWTAKCVRSGEPVTSTHVFPSTALLEVVLRLPEAKL